MQNNKPNVLLVESGGHYKVLPHLYLMLSKVFDVEVLLPKSGISKVSFIPECKLVSCLSMYFIFLSALFRGGNMIICTSQLLHNMVEVELTFIMCFLS